MDNETRGFECVFLSGTASETIVRAAATGYQRRYKEERLGMLFGSTRDETLHVVKAVLYKGGRRTRTSASVDGRRFAARTIDLRRDLRLKYLGTFHSHPEVGGSITSVMSPEDRDLLCEEIVPMVDIIATVWCSDGPLRQSKRYLQVSCVADGVPIRVRIVARRWGNGFKMVPLYSAIGENP